jgi:acetate kinase
VKSEPPCILAVNAGSSSIRFAIYEATDTLPARLDGKIDRIGSSSASLTANEPGHAPVHLPFNGADHGAAAAFLLDWLEAQPVFTSVDAVGHRVVYGMRHSEPETITPQLLEELQRLTPYDPDHLPVEVGLIDTVLHRHPALHQVACFDTAFHRTMPRVAKLLPIPRRYASRGVERYGFHGLSFSYLMEALSRRDSTAPTSRVILAHLGNGASLAAVRSGKSIDTSMGFTPASGLVMSTRTGDLDPGVMDYLVRTEGMTTDQFRRMVNRESGLLGISEISSDMRDLLAQEAVDVRAADAVALFCYQAKKWIGSFAAALGGLDTLVFAGGIGENAPVIRARICEGLEFLGVDLHQAHNAEATEVISTTESRVTVRVIRTDEELMIARSVLRSRWALPALEPNRYVH